jgi:hypothetical protein
MVQELRALCRSEHDGTKVIMKWTRLFSERLRRARMVVGSRATIHHREASPMAQTISVLGIDLAKLVFHVVGMDDAGHVVLRKRLARSELPRFIASLPPVIRRNVITPGAFQTMALWDYR